MQHTAPPQSTDPRAVSSVVFEPVIERIAGSIASTRVEVGGKLLGRLRDEGARTVMQVESYIDAGPRSDASARHLHPDGPYQESVYRLIEIFAPGLVHVGSWHTHHPNGLATLSQGDIDGYRKTVNDPRYGLPHFLAMLATGIVDRTPRLRYYLFTRGRAEFVELEPERVRLVPRRHSLEAVLAEVERVSSDRREGGAAAAATAVPTEDALRRLRAEDHAWLTAQDFASLQARVERQTGSVYWEWTLAFGGEPLRVRYVHPPEGVADAPARATLELHNPDQGTYHTSLPLDGRRFDGINALVDRVQAANAALERELAALRIGRTA